MNIRDVQKKIDVVLDNLEKLEVLKAKSYESFIRDFRNIDSALHRFQTSIQALLDIGAHIVASLGLKSPESNSEIVEILAEAGHIRRKRAAGYIKMSRFRNRIVHLYNHIDTRTLHDILNHELDDIRNFLADLLKIIERRQR